MKGERLSLTEGTLTIILTDGRTISTSLGWYPRLLHATLQERENWEWIGDHEGVHWPDLDEDISVEGIIAGRRSGESQRSLQKWLEQR